MDTRPPLDEDEFDGLDPELDDVTDDDSATDALPIEDVTTNDTTAIDDTNGADGTSSAPDTTTTDTTETDGSGTLTPEPDGGDADGEVADSRCSSMPAPAGLTGFLCIAAGLVLSRRRRWLN
jgi:hypothetical protein